MQMLLKQFIELENKVNELLDEKKALRIENIKLTETNKLLKEQSLINSEYKTTEIESHRLEEIDLRQANEEVQTYLKEIDECLIMLKALKG